MASEQAEQANPRENSSQNKNDSVDKRQVTNWQILNFVSVILRTPQVYLNLNKIDLKFYVDGGGSAARALSIVERKNHKKKIFLEWQYLVL